MSLINEALRKAQNQRSQSPGLGDGSDTGNQPINYSTAPKRFGLMIGIGFFIIILLGLVAGFTIVIISEDTPQTTQQPSPATPETVHTDDTTNASDLLPPAMVESTVSQSESFAAEIPEQPPEVIEEPVPEPEPSQEVIDWIDQSIITGVRITSDSSKVILNNKAYTPGDTVDVSLKLKILTIEPKRILFIDSDGLEYVKLF